MNCFIKKRVLILGLVLVPFVWTQAVAEQSWFDRGSSFFRSLLGDEKTESLTIGEISNGIKEALLVGSENVVKKLGVEDGFYSDPKIHIPLPQVFEKVRPVLAAVGKAGMLDDLELKLNRAAETATPKAKKLFIDAIARMTLEDVKKIYDGPDDAATRYFQSKMSPELAREMQPVVDNTLSGVGVIQAYDNIIQEYKSLPFVPDIKADLSDHVIGKAMDGIFYYLAEEEAAIRRDPVKRTTELLQKVFDKKNEQNLR